MGIFIDAFNILLYQPLFNILVLFYEYLPGHDFGVAVIVLTLLVKIILYPLGAKGIKSQRALQRIQPKIKEVQEKFKHNKEKQTRAMMDLYKQEKINPFSGLSVLLVQLPILIALFQVFWRGFKENQLQFLYGFLPHPGQINPTFLGLVNLAEASAILAVLTGLAQFIQTKMTAPSASSGQVPKKKGAPDFSEMMQKQMLYFFPIFTVFILWRLPAAVSIYWLATTLFTIGQQYITLKKEKNDHDSTRSRKN